MSASAIAPPLWQPEATDSSLKAVSTYLPLAQANLDRMRPHLRKLSAFYLRLARPSDGKTAWGVAQLPNGQWVDMKRTMKFIEETHLRLLKRHLLSYPPPASGVLKIEHHILPRLSTLLQLLSALCLLPFEESRDAPHTLHLIALRFAVLPSPTKPQPTLQLPDGRDLLSPSRPGPKEHIILPAIRELLFAGSRDWPSTTTLLSYRHLPNLQCLILDLRHLPRPQAATPSADQSQVLALNPMRELRAVRLVGPFSDLFVLGLLGQSRGLRNLELISSSCTSELLPRSLAAVHSFPFAHTAVPEAHPQGTSQDTRTGMGMGRPVYVPELEKLAVFDCQGWTWDLFEHVVHARAAFLGGNNGGSQQTGVHLPCSDLGSAAALTGVSSGMERAGSVGASSTSNSGSDDSQKTTRATPPFGYSTNPDGTLQPPSNSTSPDTTSRAGTNVSSSVGTAGHRRLLQACYGPGSGALRFPHLPRWVNWIEKGAVCACCGKESRRHIR